MNRWSRVLCVLGACAALALVPACGDDDNGGGGGTPSGLDVPEAWWGVWEQTATTTPCAEARPLMRETTVDTFQVCPDAFDVIGEEDLGGVDLDALCTETIDGNVYRIVCSGVESAFPGCDVTLDIDITATLAGDGESYAFTGSIESTSGAGCGEFSLDFCEDVDGTGRRLSDDVSDCDGGGDGGGGDATGEALVTFTGSSGPATVNFTGMSGTFADGSGYVVGANRVGSPTDYQLIGLTVPDGYGSGTTLDVVVGPSNVAASLEWFEVRGQENWTLESFTGTMSITDATSTRLSGSFSGSGSMTNGTDTENVGMSASFDAEVSPGNFERTFESSVREHVHRTIMRSLRAGR